MSRDRRKRYDKWKRGRSDSRRSTGSERRSERRIDKLEKQNPDCEDWAEKFFSKKQAEERRDELNEPKNNSYDYGIRTN